MKITAAEYAHILNKNVHENCKFILIDYNYYYFYI